MNPCTDCLYYKICFERRGICTEYKTLSEVSVIKIIDDWYITVDSYPTNYTVRRGDGKKGKNNKWIDKPKGHFNSLAGAVKEIRRLIIAERFENSVGTLETALDTITKVNARFEKIMERVTA